MKLNYPSLRSLLALSLILFCPLTFAGEAASGTIEFDNAQVLEMAGGGSASGTLTFGGASHAFTIGGMSLVSSGGMEGATVQGKVYNLNDINDFAGTYHVLESGLGVVESETSTTWLENGKKVKLGLNASDIGVDMQVQMEGITISLD